MPISEPHRLTDFIARLQSALSAVSPRKKYLIGVSGGCDSMTLLHALKTLGYRKLVVCHLNHGLRGRDALKDAALVRATSKALGYPCEEANASIAVVAKQGKKSLELAAREARHSFFLRCAQKNRCHRIFLAHHADDQIETVLFNFLRGTGAAGIAGIKPLSRIGRLEILRPLLTLTREEIATHSRRQKISWREDGSNTAAAHTRNRLRHTVLPAIDRALGPAWKFALLRAAEILREEDTWMDSLVPPVTATFSTREIQSMPLAMRRRLILRWLKVQGVPEAGFQETERVLSLLSDGSGPAKVNLPGNLHARRRAGRIFLER
jgi:tRNA(Ile)-lysidine synthase